MILDAIKFAVSDFLCFYRVFAIISDSLAIELKFEWFEFKKEKYCFCVYMNHV